MGTTSCSVCGVQVRWGTGPDGERIKLDNLPSMRGPDRYREAHTDAMVGLRVEPVTPEANVSAYKRHECRAVSG